MTALRWCDSCSAKSIGSRPPTPAPRLLRQLFAGLPPHHVLGVPIGPVLICRADAFLVLAMGVGRAPKGARQIACGSERSQTGINAPGKPGCNLLEQPDVA